MLAKDKVFKYIDQYFEYQKLESVPLLPGGTKVVMKNGDEFIVSYDFLKNEIVEHFPSGERRTPWFIVSGEDPQGYYPAGVFEEKEGEMPLDLSKLLEREYKELQRLVKIYGNEYIEKVIKYIATQDSWRV